MRTVGPILSLSGNDAYLPTGLSGKTVDEDVKSIRYQIDNATLKADDPDFVAEWRRLMAFSESHERIYQSVEYFNYLRQTSLEEGVEIFSLRDTHSGAYLGVVPVRIIDQALSFSVGSRTIAAPSVRTIALLGSVALAPMSKEVIDQLISYLFDTFKGCGAISMQALPHGCQQQELLALSDAVKARSHLYVLHGWRHCHRIPLPETFEQYQKQMSAKRRYNLNRQIKLLEKQAGAVQLQNIVDPDQVTLLMNAISTVVPPDTDANFLPESKYRALAAHGLLHCYVLKAGDRAVGLIMATRYGKTLHLHAIHHVQDMANCSIGTSILYLAIKDLTENFDVDCIDLGYGVPAHRHESTNVTVERGHVLLVRKTLRNFALIRLHGGFTQAVTFAKSLLLNYKARRLAQKKE